MIYSSEDITDALRDGRLVIDPPPEDEMFGTSAVDLRLGNRFTIPEQPGPGYGVYVTVGEADPEAVAIRYGRVQIVHGDGHLDLHPGDFVLASTLERVEMPLDLAARVEGKSSVARFGLSVHQTAPTIHADFRGTIRLEISNVGPFVCRLKPGIRICQLIVEELKNPAPDPLHYRFPNRSFQNQNF